MKNILLTGNKTGSNKKKTLRISRLFKIVTVETIENTDFSVSFSIFIEQEAC